MRNNISPPSLEASTIEFAVTQARKAIRMTTALPENAE